MRARTPAVLLTALLVSVSSLSALGTAPVAAASPVPAQESRTVVYAGYGHEVRLGAEAGLARTSPRFRHFVHRRLLHLWDLAGGTQHCRPSASVTVKAWMSSGFARAGEGIYNPCPGGGYNQIYLRREGRWTAPTALGSQEPRSCSLMRWFRIPRPVADRDCYTDLNDLVRYRTYRLPDDYSTGDYAARMVASSISGGTGAAAPQYWATPDVVRELDRLSRRADALALVRCFGPDDPEYGARLQGAPRGCLLDATEAGQAVARELVRLHPARFGRWQAFGIETVA